MTRSVYLIGPPGSGKSTLMDRLLADWSVAPEAERLTPPVRLGGMFGHPMSHRDWGHVGVYLGIRRPQFPGTDALSMSVNPVACNWATEQGGAFDLIVGEGARLANRRFIDTLWTLGHVDLIHLTGDPDVLYQRGLDRPDDGDWKPVSRRVTQPDGSVKWETTQRVAGQPQSPKYLKTRLSASAKLAAQYPSSVTLNTTEMTPEEVWDALCMIL